MNTTDHPFLHLDYEPAFASLGEQYWDRVAAAQFPQHILRFANTDLLPLLGLDPDRVAESDWIEAFGKFSGDRSFLAMCYHGYQFGVYNPNLGDGRGFLYGQVRGTDGKLYDLGTKGSGTTPYSRHADGRLTLKGGVREVLAGEALHRLGVRTSRCLSLIETGESLWRGDEPSPTRASVMVRLSRTHIRFGTFERLHYLQRSDLIVKLLDHVIEYYYPHLTRERDRYPRFYGELVLRVAEVAAQWMAAGFCHGVLNTDNMSIAGESFDYGPYAFIPTYDLRFIAAYFDYSGRYSYGNQPKICQLNLELLQRPLAVAIAAPDLEVALAQFDSHYQTVYTRLMAQKLGCLDLPPHLEKTLVDRTIELLRETQLPYHGFFNALAHHFNPSWRDDAETILPDFSLSELENHRELWQRWRSLYQQALSQFSPPSMAQIREMLRDRNPTTPLLRPQIEAVWEPITLEDNWEPFYTLLAKISS